MPEEPEAARPRRRGPTVLLIATAAVLGVVAGTCTGFVVQAGREPTALPPLSQPLVTQAEGEVEPLSAAQDRHVKTDGWMDLAEYTDLFEKPEQAFGDLATDEFRRAAVATWQVGSTQNVEIHLVQFRQERSLQAAEWTEGQQYFAGDEKDTDQWAVPGTGDGWAYVHNTPEREPGYLPVYTAQARASRGDIAVTVWISDTRPIPKKKIMDLAKREMERL